MIKGIVLCMLLAVASAQFGRPFSRRTHTPSFSTGQLFTPPEPTFTPRQHNIHTQENYVIVPILRFEQQGPENGFYNFEFETGDGTTRQEQGAPDGSNGAVTQRGSWSFSFPDGSPGHFSFVADEGGYRVESPLLPVGPPLPAHAIEQIERSARERAAGIFHDGFYDHARYGGDSSHFEPIPVVRSNQQRRRFN